MCTSRGKRVVFLYKNDSQDYHVEEDETFGQELTKYYETNNMENLKQFIHDKCIDGIVDRKSTV